MATPRYPMNIDTSGWAPFNAADRQDAMCERERQAFTAYVAKRLEKKRRTGSDDDAIFLGGVMALVQLLYAIHDNAPGDNVRDSMHQVFDFAWLQAEGILVADRAPS